MKILHLTHLYPRPYDRLLGIAMHKTIKALAAQGCIQKVLSPIAWAPFLIKNLSHKWKSYSKVPNHDLIEGIEVFYPRYLVFPKAFMLSSSGVRMYWSIKNLVRKIESEFQFDLIHAHMALPDGFAGMLISIEYKKPLVITFQATDLDITANRSPGCLSALHKVFSYAHYVISPSPRLANEYISRFEGKPTIIGYGVSTKEIYKRNKVFSSSYDGRRVLLSVSRLIPTKGIDLNIRALEKLIKKYKNLLYLIIGDGPERIKLKELARNLNLTSYIKFIGQISHEEVMKHMDNCEVFTLPSWQETFGLVYIEAMIHAKPIVAVRGQGVDGIVIHNKTGLLVKPRDVDSLVEALDFFLSHPEEARLMGERARKVVIENYTWEKNAEKTIEFYREVLNES